MKHDTNARHNAAAHITANTYNSAADHFEDPVLSFWDVCGQRTVQLASLPQGASVLDVGCGTGASALPAARAIGPWGRVVGVDLAAQLLAHGRRKAEQQGFSNVDFRVGDMAQLEFPEASFDAVICVFAIFFVPDMDRQVAELWRMLKPGGRLAITTWGPNLFEPARSLFWSAIREYRPDLERRYSPWDRVVDAESLRTLFKAAGTAEPKVFEEQAEQYLGTTEDWWTIACGTGYRWTIDQLTEDEAHCVRQQNLWQLREAGAKAVSTNFNCAVAEKS